jgi:hypothetical protein
MDAMRDDKGVMFERTYSRTFAELTFAGNKAVRHFWKFYKKSAFIRRQKRVILRSWNVSPRAVVCDDEHSVDAEGLWVSEFEVVDVFPQPLDRIQEPQMLCRKVTSTIEFRQLHQAIFHYPGSGEGKKAFLADYLDPLIGVEGNHFSVTWLFAVWTAFYFRHRPSLLVVQLFTT